MNYRMKIQYGGTRYNGWQRQQSTGNTIPGKIEAVLSRMVGVPWKSTAPGAQTPVSMRFARPPICILIPRLPPARSGITSTPGCRRISVSFRWKKRRQALPLPPAG